MPNPGNSKLYIYDRYGKLVKQLTPNGKGWDGTFNGNPLPADDYWFSIKYTEDGIPKEFKSHFSIKDK
jgi:gliding motility-associated-like protein